MPEDGHKGSQSLCEYIVGIDVLRFAILSRNGQWSFSHKIANFSDLINRIEVDHTGNIWAGHMYKGVYRLRMDEQLQKLLKKNIFFTRFSTKLSKSHRVMKLGGLYLPMGVLLYLR